MTLVLIVIVCILSLFSTGVMSYVALATPIGPWIAPTLVLMSTCLIRLLPADNANKLTMIALATAGSSVGGILATALAFSFPTLYFLDPTLFLAWMAQPWYFCLIMFFLSIAAGGLGFIIANMLEKKCIEEEQMSFPIGQVTYEMIAVQNQGPKVWQLLLGFLTTIFFSIFQSAHRFIGQIIPRVITIIKTITWGPITIPTIQLRMDIFPMLLAIGFITGHVIAIPLAVGSLAKIIMVDPLNRIFFSYIHEMDFILAFCSGMVVIGALQSFFDFPLFVNNFSKKLKRSNAAEYYTTFAHYHRAVNTYQLIIIASIIIGFLLYFKFSILNQLYLIIGTIICTYQIIIIAGKIGMAQLGRFATFVMAPAMILFGIDVVKLTLTATFVEICGGVATDMLFGRKMGFLGNLNRQQVRNYQLLGLLVSSLCIGIIFWLFIHHFGLGSEHLFAQRAQARALLINATHFNFGVLFLGAIFGLVLKKIKVNPMLVLGGLLMPLAYSLGLIIGGFIAMFFSNKQEWEPFWSGVYAANSVTELIKTVW